MEAIGRASRSFACEAGDFDTRGITLQAVGVNERWAHHLSANAFTSDGHREQSDTCRTRINAKVTRMLDGGRELQGS